ncbi:MAG: PAS domain S-box protein [Candidatus Verstraetearchaeota archaeon]|nr:PAS domain S-box protein [Candidatus Verstraetearchaeota archaeon]
MGKPKTKSLPSDLIESLKKGEVNYLQLIEHAHEGVWIIDANSTTTFVNRRMAEMLGYTVEEMIGRHLFDLMEKRGVEKAKKLLERRRSGVSEQHDFAFLRKDGSRIHTILETAPITDADGKYIGAAAFVTDVTERRKIEEALRKSEERYRSIAENVTAGLTFVEDGKVVYVNDRACEILGYPREELLTLKGVDLAAPEDRKRVQRLWKDALGKDPEQKETEFWVIRKDGTKRYIHNRYSSVHMGGRSSGLLVTTVDITERKEAERELQEKEAKYRELADSITEVFFALDDELRITYWNRASEILTGTPAKEAIGRSHHALFPTAREAKVEALYMDVLRTQQPKFLVAQFDVRGRDCSFEISAYPSKSGLSVFVRDITDRKRMEEALRKSEEKYRELVENANSIILKFDRKGTILSMNEFGQKFFGFTEEELLGKNLIGTIVPEYESTGRGLRTMIEDMCTNEEKYRINVNENIRKNGERVWIYWTNRPTRDEKGDAIAILSVGTDITERMRNDEKLRAAHQQLQDIIDFLPDATFVIDKDGKVIAWNRAIEELSGVSKAEIIGKGDHEYAHKFYGEQRLGLIDLVTTSNPEVEAKYDLIERRGNILYAESFLPKVRNGKGAYVSAIASPRFDSKGNIIGAIQSIRDITERKQMERELRKYSERLEGMVEERAKELHASEEKLRMIIDSFPDTIVVVAPDGKITECNQTALGLLKASTKEELIGRAFLDFVAQKDRKLALESMAVLQSQGHARDFELNFLSKDGLEVPVVISVAPLQAKSDGPGSAVAIVKDITQRKMAEAELRKAMAIRDQFISNITHELRTPLVSMAGYLNYIASGYMGPVPEAMKGGLEVVRRNTNRLVNLTNDLLDVQRIQAGKIQLELEPLDFREILDQCIKEIAPFVYEKKQTLKMKVQATPLRMHGDRTKLSQVVTNILSNASKFTSDEGTITIRAEEDAKAIKVQISDTGIGIREEDLKRVFEPFAVINKPFYAKGTGLGLSVTKGLVEAHGGRVWAESPGEGKGATFTFILPKEVGGAVVGGGRGGGGGSRGRRGGGGGREREGGRE